MTLNLPCVDKQYSELKIKKKIILPHKTKISFGFGESNELCKKIVRLAVITISIVSFFVTIPVYAQENAGIVDSISVYTVAKGDTISDIAEKYNVTTNTILLANDLKEDSKIKIGQKLVMLPVSGVKYTVKSGDTLEGIAKKFNANQQDIAEHNKIKNVSLLRIGDVLIIPDNELPSQREVKAPADTKPLNKITQTASKLISTISNYFIKPVEAATKTQGIHGKNGVDLADVEGTPIYAAATGTVLVSRIGWNGGYGDYVVIEHPNGTQTLYAHNSENLVEEGDEVRQGEEIAHMGSTGKSTGSHVHFEVRGAKNPF